MINDPLTNLSRYLMREIAEQVVNTDDPLWLRETCSECRKEQCCSKGGVCTDCQVKGLSYVVGTALAEQYRAACVELLRIKRMIINTSEGTCNGREEKRVEDRAAEPPAAG